MIADYEVYAKRRRVCYLVVSLYPAVENYHKFHILCRYLVDYGTRYSVAFLVARGDVEVQFGIEILEVSVDKSDGRCAVDIIIPVNKYFFLGTHGAVEPFDGLVHVRHKKRIVEVAQRGMEKFLGALNGRDTPLDEQIADRRAVGETPRKLLPQLLFLRCKTGIIPFSCHI